MKPEVTAALIGATAPLLLWILSFIQQKRERRLSAEVQKEQGEALAELQKNHAQQNAAFEAELARQAKERDERSQREQVMYRFREPLARSAYDLQSRLYNIVNCAFLDAYLVRGSEREKSYAVNNTMFLIAQYFAWAEIVRREIHYIDLGHQEKTRLLATLQDDITHIWGTDLPDFPTNLRIWAGEQRALGELLIQEGPRGPTCMGFSQFTELLHADRSPLLSVLAADVAELPSLPRAQSTRVSAVQNALIDLIDFLDPDHIRFPPEYLSKVSQRTQVKSLRSTESQRSRVVDVAGRIIGS
ncbi:MAG TPA: hypothetical protein VF665_02440 [Longimicrobium sp.]|uniref:hypothetical protein n=1 Tax=Longimicrobium sp. TaxID=2029185 RepID=UPI002ED9A078